MNPGYATQDPSSASVAVQPLPVRSAYRRQASAPDDNNFWSTVGRYAVFGALAAAAIDTLARAKGPRDLVDGVLLAVNATLDGEAALEDTRFNTGLFTFFAPAVAAAGVVLAIQIGRQLSKMQE